MLEVRRRTLFDMRWVLCQFHPLQGAAHGIGDMYCSCGDDSHCLFPEVVSPTLEVNFEVLPDPVTPLILERPAQSLLVGMCQEGGKDLVDYMRT